MKILDWFKPQNKKNVVLPSIEPGKQLEGVELILAFTTEDEPKCAEYPKKYYKVYWETFVEAIPNGYGALVRIYSFDGGSLVMEKRFVFPSVLELKNAVNSFIRTTLEQNKR